MKVSLKQKFQQIHKNESSLNFLRILFGSKQINSYICPRKVWNRFKKSRNFSDILLSKTTNALKTNCL